MNIIISEELHNNLQKHIVSTIEFGSGLKGESTSSSDKDLLHIVESVDWWVSSTIANQHLLQYKTENEDHIYCNAHTFVKSLLDGDTTIFVEMHRFGGLNNTCLEFLNKYEFVYYRTLRAYLGISRRDMKDIKKLWKTKNFRKMNKKFKFTKQGLDIVIDTMKKNVKDESFYSNYNIKYCELFNKVIDVTNMTYAEMDELVTNIIDLTEFVRERLNQAIEKKELKKTLELEEFLSLTKELNHIDIISGMEDCKDEIMTHFYNSYIGNI